MTHELEGTVPKAEYHTLEAKVNRIYDALFIGDGKVKGEGGLVDTIRDLKRQVDDIIAERNKKLSLSQGFGLAVAGGVITQAFGFVLHILKEVTKQ